MKIKFVMQTGTKIIYLEGEKLERKVQMKKDACLNLASSMCS